jgi:hypothetical protein
VHLTQLDSLVEHADLVGPLIIALHQVSYLLKLAALEAFDEAILAVVRIHLKVALVLSAKHV